MSDTAGTDAGDRETLIGRDGDLSAIDSFLTDDGRSGCMVLVGDSGIGKTTLWEAGIARAQALGWQVLSSRCSHSEANLSFASLSDLLDGVDLSTAHLPLPQREALEVALGLRAAASAAGEPLNTAAGLLGVIRHLAQRRPLLIAVDDVHWMDRASADCVTFAARRLRALPVRFLVSRHPGPATDIERELKLVGVVARALEGLSYGAIRALVTARVSNDLSHRAVRRIAETSQGNPLFALELARALAERGELSGAGDPLVVPELIEELLARRIQDMPAQLVRALLAVSLSGGLTPIELGRVVDPMVVEDAVTIGYLTVDRSKLRPTHPLLLAIIRRDSAAEDRRRLHHDLAEAIADPSLRVRHLAAAAAGVDPKLAEQVSEASHWAVERGDRALAEELALHALRLTPRGDPAFCDRVTDLARCHITAGNIEAAVTLLSERIGEFPKGAARARAHLVLGECLPVYGEQAQLDLALSESGDDPVTTAKVLARRAMLLMINMVERIDEAERLAQQALDCDRAGRPSGDPWINGRVAHALAWAGVLSGHNLGDIPYTPEPDSITFYDAGTERPCAVGLAFRGDTGPARAQLAELSRLAEQQGEVRLSLVLGIQSCELELRCGRVEAAAACLADVGEWMSEEPVPLVTMRLQAVLAAVTGNPDDVRALIGEEFQQPDPDSYPMWDWLEIQRAIGLVELMDGNWAQAARHLHLVWDHTVQQRIEEPGAFPVAADLVQALMQTGDMAGARAVLDRLDRLARDQEHPWGLATAQRCLAMLVLAQGYDQRWAQSMSDAAARYGELGLEFDQGRTLLCLGDLARRHNKRGDARQYLEQASAVFDGISCSGWAAAARTELGRVSGRKATATELTAAERQVVELAAAGLSNKEIAARQFVSVYTVEAHLSHAYAKLGIRSRSQLSGRLEQLGRPPRVPVS